MGVLLLRIFYSFVVVAALLLWAVNVYFDATQGSPTSGDHSLSGTRALKQNEDTTQSHDDAATAVDSTTPHRYQKGGPDVFNIVDYGAVADNATDNTKSFRMALKAIEKNGGGELLIPAPGIFQTAPFNLTSNIVLTVQGTIRGVADQHKYNILPPLYWHGRDPDFGESHRRQSLVHAYEADNITIRGGGTIDGAGWYWYPFFHDHNATFDIDNPHVRIIGRPHLMELRNCTNVDISGVTMKDSPFWTMHHVGCQNVTIHHMQIQAPSCKYYKCANTDGIDIDSSQNVLIEHNYINVGDDHVTILAGKKPERHPPPSRNVTVRHNTLGSGMGLCIGSSTAGGIEDVLYYNNTMRAEVGQFGNGLKIKTRQRFGGYVRRVSWIDNTFYVAGKPGGAIVIEAGYQKGTAWQNCTDNSGPFPCTEIRDILIRNATVHVGNPGRLLCYENMPCRNITLEHVTYADKNARIRCANVHSGRVRHTDPPQLLDPELCSAFYGEEGGETNIN